MKRKSKTPKSIKTSAVKRKASPNKTIARTVAASISGTAKSQKRQLQFRLAKIFAVTALLVGGIGKMAHAQSRCEISQSVRGCVKSLDQLAREQQKNEPKLGSINVNKSFHSLVSEVNGKNLKLDHWSGSYVMKISASKDDVKLELNGERIKGEQLCFEVCANEDKVTWYHPEQGVIKRAKNGLTVDGRYFKIVN